MPISTPITFLGSITGSSFISTLTIKMRTTVKKGNRYIQNSWAFYQLRLFIEYKAIEAGIPVIVIDPHNTSRECPN